MKAPWWYGCGGSAPGTRNRRGITPAWGGTVTQHTRLEVDSDLRKGAVEGPDGEGNPNAPALDQNGMPNDEVAIAQDVLGANEDETQG